MATELTKDRDVSEHGARLILITLGIIAATLMQTLDSTIVNVALPTIQGNLGATQEEGAWVVTGYIISAVIVIPLTPWLQARFGRRQYYSVAIIGFTVASMLCGISGSIQQLVLYRIIQGLFGGGLIATGQAALRDTFPRHLLGASQAVFALGAIVGPSVGPTVGGWLTDNISWNWVFFINLVPGIFAAVVILTMMRNPSDPKPIPVDARGLGLLAVGLGSLQYILDEGQRNDWFDSPAIRVFATTAVFGMIAFVCWELWGTSRPIVDLRAFKYRAIAAGAADQARAIQDATGGIQQLDEGIAALSEHGGTLAENVRDATAEANAGSEAAGRTQHAIADLGDGSQRAADAMVALEQCATMSRVGDWADYRDYLLTAAGAVA